MKTRIIFHQKKNLRIPNLTIIVLIILSQISCYQKNIRLKGHFTGGHPEWVRIDEITPRQFIFFDSVQINKHNEFKIEKKINGQKFLRLKSSKGEILFLIAYPGDEITINGNFNDLQATYMVEGSYESTLIRDYMKQFNFALQGKRKIADNFYERTSSGEDVELVRKDLIEKHNQIKSEIRSFTMDFILKNKCFLASVFILDLQLGPDDPILTLEEDYKYFAMVDSCLSAKFSENEIVQEYNKNLIVFNENKKNNNRLTAKIGSKAPEIALPDTIGDTIFLSSLSGKYVLIDFWASWNTDCRKNNNQLLKIYNLYKKKGFEIYQISLDKSKDNWLKAIVTDQTPWIHVSDLKFWDSYVVNLYNVYSIPANFLLNPKGEIIGINMVDEELNNTLASIFK